MNAKPETPSADSTKTDAPADAAKTEATTAKVASKSPAAPAKVAAAVGSAVSTPA